MSATNLNKLRKMKADKEKFTCLTAYDSTFAALFDRAGIDMLLVGDTLGMVIQGHGSTLPVTVNDIIYHCQNVRRGSSDVFVMADMPFMSYTDPATGLHNAARMLQEGFANIVKLEGGAAISQVVETIAAQGIPVCAHLGLQPQSVNKIGGFRVQGKDTAAAQRMVDDALILQKAGADMLLLECVPTRLADELTAKLDIPVLGIGAGPGCDGQVLVCYDMLGMSGYSPKFVKNFLRENGDVEAAVKQYINEVKAGRFPGPEQSYG